MEIKFIFEILTLFLFQAFSVSLCRSFLFPETYQLSEGINNFCSLVQKDLEGKCLLYRKYLPASPELMNAFSYFCSLGVLNQKIEQND